MKTRASHLFKVIFMTALVSTLMVSCGQKNKSGGGGGSSTAPGTGYGGYGGTNGNYMAVIENENPCLTQDKTRIASTVALPAQIQVNVGAIHVGVTLEGDIAIVSRQNDVPTIEFRTCRRPGMTGGQPQMVGQFVINSSVFCPVSEITAATAQFPAQSGPYTLSFFPIHVPGTNKISSLCQN